MVDVGPFDFVPESLARAAIFLQLADPSAARLEGLPGIRERGRDLMGRVMPPEASQHFRNAGREQLLGIRSIVDFWIRRIDAMEDRSGDESREKISID